MSFVPPPEGSPENGEPLHVTAYALVRTLMYIETECRKTGFNGTANGIRMLIHKNLSREIRDKLQIGKGSQTRH